MNRENIIRMARKAGLLPNYEIYEDDLERFAALIAAAEREACATACEELRDDWFKGLGRYEFMSEGADFCAEAIRARSQS